MTAQEGFSTDIPGNPDTVFAAATWIASYVSTMKVACNNVLRQTITAEPSVPGGPFGGPAAMAFSSSAVRLRLFIDAETDNFDGTADRVREYAEALVEGQAEMRRIRVDAKTANLTVTPDAVLMGEVPGKHVLLPSVRSEKEGAMEDDLVALSDRALVAREKVITAADAIEKAAKKAWERDDDLGQDAVKTLARLQYDVGIEAMGGSATNPSNLHTTTMKWVGWAGSSMDAFEAALRIADGEPGGRVAFSVLGSTAGASAVAFAGGYFAAPGVLVVGGGVLVGWAGGKAAEGLYDHWFGDDDKPVKISAKDRARMDQFDCGKYVVGAAPSESFLR